MNANIQKKKPITRFCPTDGSLLGPNKFCSRCQKQINIQNQTPRKPRNFYEKMPEGIEDNYVDEMFLQGLVHKNSFPELHYPSMIRETLEIVHVINTLVHFLVGFKYLTVGNFEEDIFFKILTGCFFFFLAFISIHWSHYTLKNLVNDVKTAGFLTTALLFLTPVLKSLTVSYSDDTIILWVVIFIILHLLMYDYTAVKRQVAFDNITRSIVGSPVSLNAIFFATILLSSRLEKVRQVYLLLLLSMILFGFIPLFRQSLRNYNRNLADAMAVAATIWNFTMILSFSQLHASVFLLTIIFITMISPMLFIYAYQFKNDIQGPWDLPDVIQHVTID